MESIMKQGVIKCNTHSIEFDKQAMKRKMQELCRRFPHASSVFVNIKTTYKTSSGSKFILKDPRTKISDTIMHSRDYDKAIDDYIESVENKIQSLYDAVSGSLPELEEIDEISITIVRSQH